MDPMPELAQLQLDFMDPIQRRYEVIRPLVLFSEGTATQRAQDTDLHPDTVRRWLHDFRHDGMRGLLPAVVPREPRRGATISEAVREEIDRLKALYGGFHARELARILFLTLGERIDHKTAQRLWHASPVVPQERLPLRTVASPTAPYQMRLQVIQLYYQGWDKVSISRFLHLARTTIDRWIATLEAIPAPVMSE